MSFKKASYLPLYSHISKTPIQTIPIKYPAIIIKNLTTGPCALYLQESINKITIELKSPDIPTINYYIISPDETLVEFITGAFTYEIYDIFRDLLVDIDCLVQDNNTSSKIDNQPQTYIVSPHQLIYTTFDYISNNILDKEPIPYSLFQTLDYKLKNRADRFIDTNTPQAQEFKELLSSIENISSNLQQGQDELDILFKNRPNPLQKKPTHLSNQELELQKSSPYISQPNNNNSDNPSETGTDTLSEDLSLNSSRQNPIPRLQDIPYIESDQPTINSLSEDVFSTNEGDTNYVDNTDDFFSSIDFDN